MRNVIFTICWLALLVATATDAQALQAVAGETLPAKPKTPPNATNNIYKLEMANLDRQLAVQAQVLERSRKDFHDLETPELERTLQVQIDRLRDELIAKQIIADPPVLTRLMSRRVDLIIDLSGLTARQAALQEKPQNSAKRQFLNEQLQLQSEMLEAVARKRLVLDEMVKKGVAPDVERQELDQMLLAQRLKLAEIKHQLDSIDSESSLLSETALQIAEKRAQLEMVDQLLREVAQTRPIQAELEILQSRLERLRTTREMGIADSIRRAEAAFQELKQDRAKIEIRLLGIDQQENHHDDH